LDWRESENSAADINPSLASFALQLSRIDEVTGYRLDWLKITAVPRAQDEVDQSDWKSF
jgi:hypothetical protein